MSAAFFIVKTGYKLIILDNKGKEDKNVENVDNSMVFHKKVKTS